MDKTIKTILFILSVLLVIGLAFYLFSRDGKVNTDNINTDQASTTLANQNNDINNNQNKNMENSNEVKEYKVVVLHTNMGDISIELAKDKPLTTSNFIKLASSNFYNNVKFHRVINGFMIQTGDPLSKDGSQKMYWGTGGPGYKFADELTGSEKYVVGTVAMANSGPNTNGSQFFIMTSDTPLPPSYTVFGKVIAGQDVAQKIQDVATDANDRPISDIIINSIDLK